MKRTYSDYVIKMNDGNVKIIYLQVMPIEKIINHVKKYYQNAISITRIFNANNTKKHSNEYSIK